MTSPNTSEHLLATLYLQKVERLLEIHLYISYLSIFIHSKSSSYLKAPPPPIFLVQHAALLWFGIWLVVIFLLLGSVWKQFECSNGIVLVSLGEANWHKIIFPFPHIRTVIPPARLLTISCKSVFFSHRFQFHLTSSCVTQRPASFFVSAGLVYFKVLLSTIESIFVNTSQPSCSQRVPRARNQEILHTKC